jgi:Ni,Fe-hydrogenase I cytochrome b subunit
LPRSSQAEETAPIPYTKQFVLSKPTQYKKLRVEWRSNVYLAKSRIQVCHLFYNFFFFLIIVKILKGLGLYAARDLEKHTMVIEYIGELIRNEVANRREKLYDQQVDIYLFFYVVIVILYVYFLEPWYLYVPC